MGSKKIKQPKQNGIVKVPVVMQLEALECGAASLTMVLAYYNKWIPLEQVRLDCGVSRDGSNAKNVLIAARNYGLNAKGYRFSVEGLREKGTFPCIIHWGFNHFVVCDGFKGNYVYLNDPAKGDYKVDMQTFDENFTGVALLFEPGENFEPSGRKRSSLTFAKKRMAGTGVAIIFAVTTTVIGALLTFITPAFSRIFIDRLLTHKNPDWLVGFLIALSAISAIEIFVQLVQANYNLQINGKFAATGNATFMWKVLHLPMEFFSQRIVGDIEERRSSNAEVANSLVNTLAPLVINSVMMIFYLVIMIRYSLPLTVIGIASIVINMFVSSYISKKRINISRVLMRDEGKLAGVTVSGIEMIETIKATGAEDGFFEKWSGYYASVNSQNEKAVKQDLYLGMIPTIVSQLTSSAIMILGAWLTMNGQFTVGMIMAFQGFLEQFTGPADDLISAGQTLMEMRCTMERIEDVMEYPDDVVFESDIETDDYAKLSGKVELKNITFGYSRLAEPLIKDFSMTIEQGSKVAFVGSSGCGKSTLSKLIAGLYQPWEGEILFDGKPMKEIPRSVFTGSLAVVDQDIIMFEDTISNNIKMWDNSIENYEVILAARDAQIHEDIMQRDGGYQSMVSGGGKNFSGGQRQRLEIARVLAQDPTIIVMDEATSALDAKTEYDTVKAIRDRGITSIVVAHRLSTIRDCDEIIVLDHGKVVERGTHDELFAMDGYYRKLIAND